MNSLKTNFDRVLVNFKVSPETLMPFDHSCVLARKTRTQVITELMNDYSNKMGSDLKKRVAAEKEIHLALKNAAMSADQAKAQNVRGDEQSAGKSRLKRKFSSFLELGSGPAGLV